MQLLHSKKIFYPIIITLLLFLSACSHSSKALEASVTGSQVNLDPFEKTNRGLFKFNAGLDKFILKPAAKGYKTITPKIVDSGITNFFLNLEDISNAFNNLLQLKPGEALIDTERFLFNSTIGLAGFFDVATEMGMEKHDEDFGQTLAHWGVKSGPYIMLPVLGPSTLRDATAKLTVDNLTNPAHYADESLYLFALKMLDKRADYLTAEGVFEDLSDDDYSAIRDAWLQRREYLIRDGKTDEESDADLINELESLE